MLDDLMLGLKNVKNVFARTQKRRPETKQEPSFLAHLDVGTDATI
jgi:hypothetical protein